MISYIEWPESLTDDEMRKVVGSIEESRAAFAREYIHAMAGEVDREILADGGMVAGTYGKCPVCSAPVTIRERRLNGDDRCANGHVFASSRTVR
jgi:hypothetical protein